MFSDMSNSIPGVDEAMSFAELMKMVQNMDFSCIVFDTAPTGHTLRLLSFPTIMDKALSKLMDLKNKFSGLLSQFGNMFGGGGVSEPSKCSPWKIPLGKLPVYEKHLRNNILLYLSYRIGTLPTNDHIYLNENISLS